MLLRCNELFGASTILYTEHHNIYAASYLTTSATTLGAPGCSRASGDAKDAKVPGGKLGL